MIYCIIFKRSVQKDIRKIPAAILSAIKSKIDGLATHPIPESAKKLSGYANVYRLRYGTYRIVYEVRKSEIIVVVIRIAHRRDVYRKLAL